MSFGQWYLRRGRITRRTYWLHYVLPITALGVLAFLADLALGLATLDGSASSNSASGSVQLGWISIIVSLLTVVPSISSQVTRLHDRGHSAWWLMFALIPLVGAILLLVQTGFLRGDGGPNRYGPPPAGGTPVPDPSYPQPYA
ncbi:MAG: conserved rane protein of unknown function [Modestobacter sp.]|jgi:uncharacterized membrane protein YhaH (DUF805 family)|nr:conserved rane protein of unknown function [Modestobacter sp.]